jgi:hypothetical protein
MITTGLCLVYYGLGLLVYQLYGWLVEGRWTSYSVHSLWQAFGWDTPAFQWQGVNAVVQWLLAWPLSLTLILVGAAVIGLVFASRWLRSKRDSQQRRRWITEECREMGYSEWKVPEVLAQFDERGGPAGLTKKKQFS